MVTVLCLSNVQDVTINNNSINYAMNCSLSLSKPVDKIMFDPFSLCFAAKVAVIGWRHKFSR